MMDFAIRASIYVAELGASFMPALLPFALKFMWYAKEMTDEAEEYVPNEHSTN